MTPPRVLAWSAMLACSALACSSPPVVEPAPPRVASPPALAPVEPPADLAIDIERSTSQAGFELAITERFAASSTGLTRVDLPSTFAGQEGFEKGLGEIVVEPAGATLARESSTSLAITSPPRAPLSLRYRVHETPVEAGKEHRRPYRPIFERDYVHFFGHGVFAIPHDDDAARSIALAWSLPDGWISANSFGQSERKQRFVARPSEVAHGVYVAGDLRLTRVDVRDRPVFVAVHGRFGFEDAAIVDTTRRIVGVEREFWQDDDFPYFLVSVLSTGDRCCAYAGTAVTNAFATFLSTDRGVDARIAHLFAHELFHAWNGQRIGRASPERLVYWFSEGFTEYYALLLELRANLVDLKGYVGLANEELARYALSPALRVGNREVLDRFWKDEAVERIPYQRGALLAASWNARIKAATNGARSLDDAMRDLLAAAKARGVVVSDESVASAIDRYLPGVAAGDIDRFVSRGEPIPPEPTALGPCVKLEEIERPTFDRGYEVDRERGVLKDVRKDGPAFKAGLRDGQAYVRATYTNGRPDLPARVTVRAAKGETTFEFFPAGKPARVPQYRLDEAELSRDPARCLAWFGAKAP